MKNVLIFLFFLVVLLEALFIKNLYNKRATNLPPYSFHLTELPPDDAYLTVKGSWVSDTDLAFPFQTITLKCYKKIGHCFKFEADINDGYLFTHVDLLEIETWDEERITLEPEELECVTYETEINLINEEVTSIRRETKNSGFCENTNTEPIYLRLQDGYERLIRYGW